MNDLTHTISELMVQNRRTSGVYTYTVPSLTSYPYQWFWDSCFHAIILSHLDTKMAENELRALVAHQYKNGFIAHVTYWEHHHVLPVEWGLPNTSSLIQPPLIAYATKRVFEATKDTTFLEELYPSLKRYYEYLLRERDIRGVGLVGIVNPDESGEDNSPRFDRDLGIPSKHHIKEHYVRRTDLFADHRECGFNATCTSRSFWVEDVPMNAFLVWNLTCMSELAYTLGKKRDSNKFLASATKVKEAMRTHMFKNGQFWSLGGHDHAAITTKTLAPFMPLIAGLYTQQEAAILIEEHLLNPDTFWLPNGVPTTAVTDPAFDPEESDWGEPWQHPTWRGPIWMSMHWFLFHGLRAYGYTDIATELRQKSLALIEQSGFAEYYHPHTGDGMGTKDFTWGGLVLDMDEST